MLVGLPGLRYGGRGLGNDIAAVLGRGPQPGRGAVQLDQSSLLEPGLFGYAVLRPSRSVRRLCIGLSPPSSGPWRSGPFTPTGAAVAMSWKQPASRAYRVGGHEWDRSDEPCDRRPRGAYRWSGGPVLIQSQQAPEHGGRRRGAAQRADDRRRQAEDVGDPFYAKASYQSCCGAPRLCCGNAAG